MEHDRGLGLWPDKQLRFGDLPQLTVPFGGPYNKDKNVWGSI